MQETSAGVSFAVRVQPRAKRNAVLGEMGGALKIALTAPPADGRANQACVEFLAEALDLPRSAIEILSGVSSRNKMIRVSGCKVETVREKFQRLSHSNGRPLWRGATQA